MAAQPTRLRIGGVPEHFNLPWILAMEHNRFAAGGVDLAWTFYAGGTGAMTRAMAEGELDLAILLTEGFVSASAKGLDALIVKSYIETPLTWGIYTGARSDIHAAETCVRPCYAISRQGSGSHLMAMIHAKKNGLEPSSFQIVHSLDGAVAALSHLKADLFFWERFMTRPYVQSGELREISTFAAPWSGFLVAATRSAESERREAIRSALTVMNKACHAFTEDPATPALLASRFHFTPSEAAVWLAATRWSNDFTLRRDDLTAAADALRDVGEHPAAPADPSAMCSTLVQLI
jgi:ABC-type nitrate/sulfonate/bicarbonate transport system substrate-binding protein